MPSYRSVQVAHSGTRVKVHSELDQRCVVFDDDLDGGLDDALDDALDGLDNALDDEFNGQVDDEVNSELDDEFNCDQDYELIDKNEDEIVDDLNYEPMDDTEIDQESINPFRMCVSSSNKRDVLSMTNSIVSIPQLVKLATAPAITKCIKHECCRKVEILPKYYGSGVILQWVSLIHIFYFYKRLIYSDWMID